MKKLILFAAILFAGVSVVKAQEVIINDTKQSELTVKLSPIQSIEVDGNVEIVYETAAHYSGEGESVEGTTVKVVSAGGYIVRVYAADLKTENGNTILASTIGVEAKATGDALGVPVDGVTLADDTDKIGTVLINSATGGVDLPYNIKFKGKGKNTYMDNYNAGQAGGDDGVQVYTTTVYYTISAL